MAQVLPFLIESTFTHKNITKLLPKQFRFGNSSTEITEHNSQNISVRWTQGFSNPQLTMITETYSFQKQFGSVITEQELPERIQK